MRWVSLDIQTQHIEVFVGHCFVFPNGWRGVLGTKKECIFWSENFAGVNHFQNSSSWWFQPIWKICSSNWITSPSRGRFMKNIWNHQPDNRMINHHHPRKGLDFPCYQTNRIALEVYPQPNSQSPPGLSQFFPIESLGTFKNATMLLGRG